MTVYEFLLDRQHQALKQLQKLYHSNNFQIRIRQNEVIDSA